MAEYSAVRRLAIKVCASGAVVHSRTARVCERRWACRVTRHALQRCVRVPRPPHVPGVHVVRL
jgi:hypothetical protein